MIDDCKEIQDLATREGWIAALTGLALLLATPFLDIPPVIKFGGVLGAFGCAQIGRTKRKTLNEAELALQDEKAVKRLARIEFTKLEVMRNNPGLVLPLDASFGQSTIQPGEAELIDLAKEFVLRSSKNLQHLWLSSITGTGKTVFMSALTYELHQMYGVDSIRIVDAKGSNWCGLMKLPEVYTLSNKPEFVPRAMTTIQDVVNLMETRQDQRMAQGGKWGKNSPDLHVLIVEEFNSLLGIVDEYDSSFPKKDNPRYSEKICRLLSRIISQGREDNVMLIITGQTSRVEDIGLNTGKTKNMVFACFARGYQYAAIEDALSSKMLISPMAKPSLASFLNAHKLTHPQGFEIPLVLTNFNGWGYIQLPNYSEVEFVDLYPDVENPFLNKMMENLVVETSVKSSTATLMENDEHRMFRVACEEEYVGHSFIAWLSTEEEEIQRLYAGLIAWSMNHPGTHSARDLIADCRVLRGAKAPFIREMFLKFERHSIGFLEGKGNRMKWGLTPCDGENGRSTAK